MDIAEVYRVEGPSGHGPYGHAIGAGPLYDIDTHPGPYEDGLADYSSCYYFGFRSLKRLRDWFSAATPRNRDDMRKQKYVVAIYHAPEDCIRDGNSEKQLIFIKEKATLIERLPLDLAWDEADATGETRQCLKNANITSTAETPEHGPSGKPATV